MTWTIKYYNESVENDILSLPSGLKAHYFRLADSIIEHGAYLGGQRTKYLRNGLIELRLRGKEGIARVMFCTVINNEIVVLHCFVKKTQKTPKKAMAIALERLKEVKKNENSR